MKFTQLKKAVRFFLMSVLFLSMIGCMPTRDFATVVFEETAPKVYTKNDLRDFLKSKENASVVLRVPTDNAGNLYTLIEQELLFGGFSVKDRILVEEVEVMKGENEEMYYLSKTNLEEVDLILEVNLNRAVQYGTDGYLNGKGEPSKVHGTILLDGSKLVFKTILIDSKEIVGVYEFNSAPCKDGCNYYVDASGRLFNNVDARISDQIRFHEWEDSNSFFEDYLLSCMKTIIADMRE